MKTCFASTAIVGRRMAAVGLVLFLPLALQAASAPAAKPAPNPAALWAKLRTELNENIRHINQIMATPALQQVGLDALARQTGVAAETIEATRRKSALSYGDLATGLIIAKSAGIPYEQVKTERRSRSWADIAILHKVNLAQVNEKLAGVKTTVDQFVAKLEEEEAQRAMAEERRMLRMRGIPPPPPPPPAPDLPPQQRPNER